MGWKGFFGERGGEKWGILGEVCFGRLGGERGGGVKGGGMRGGD